WVAGPSNRQGKAENSAIKGDGSRGSVGVFRVKRYEFVEVAGRIACFQINQDAAGKFAGIRPSGEGGSDPIGGSCGPREAQFLAVGAVDRHFKTGGIALAHVREVDPHRIEIVTRNVFYTHLDGGL